MPLSQHTEEDLSQIVQRSPRILEEINGHQSRVTYGMPRNKNTWYEERNASQVKLSDLKSCQSHKKAGQAPGEARSAAEMQTQDTHTGFTFNTPRDAYGNMHGVSVDGPLLISREQELSSYQVDPIGLHHEASLNEDWKDYTNTADQRYPPSALHSGDFKQRPPQQTAFVTNEDTNPPLRRISPSTMRQIPGQGRFGCDSVAPWAFENTAWFPPLLRRQSQIASSPVFVLKAPTTPLIQQSTTSDLDQSRSNSPPKGFRRHTLSTNTFQEWTSLTPPEIAGQPLCSLTPYSQERTLPRYHGDHRSATSVCVCQNPIMHPLSSLPGSRRTSQSFDASARQKASMVGSYEESILHGRMSTAPSKPFEFSAHIGALGRGKKPKMPAHIVVPFQAVFYDWSSNTESFPTCDEPSPYVGDIDLNNTEHPVPLRRRSITQTSCTSSFPKAREDPQSSDPMRRSSPPAKNGRRRQQGPIDLSRSSYRIPEQGQIQVVLKNPHKTALKLFLVPYNLRGMQPRQKTFVRQRSYSTGPVIEQPLAANNDVSLPPSEARKPILRYLIHLKICCPMKGFFYLYDNIRVVFANRVPDDKEYLTKELQEPEPKYSAWKPESDTSHPPTLLVSSASSRAYKRVSLDSSARFVPKENCSHSYGGFAIPHLDANAPPVPPIPPFVKYLKKEGAPRHAVDFGQDPLAATPHLPISCQGEPSIKLMADTPGRERNVEDQGLDDYIKLKQGENGYGGSFSLSGTLASGEGLLTRRLRGLDMYSDSKWDN